MMLTVTFQAQQQVKYSYDVNGQLTKVEYKGKQVSEYLYDKTGNRTQSKNDALSVLPQVELLQLITIHPNPVNDNIFTLATSLSVTKIELMDITGKLQLSLLPKTQGNVSVILPSGFVNGIYLCRITVPQGTVTTKLIIQ